MKKILVFLLMSFMFVLVMCNTAYGETELEEVKNKEVELYAEEDVSKVKKSLEEASSTKIEQPEVDSAYQRLLDEENYVVDLINRLEPTANTTRSNWRYNLRWIQDNYTLLKELKNENINFIYVDSYKEGYELVLLDINLPSEKKINSNDVQPLKMPSSLPTTTSTSTTQNKYSANDAVAYANEYYKKYNPSYPDWGKEHNGDCANFVSQCLFAGGKAKVYGEPTDFSKWFSDGNKTDIKKVSSTWRGADAFKHYWMSNAKGYKKFTSYDEAHKYGRKGDVVSLLRDTGRAYHTVIIVKRKKDDLIYAAHTNDTNTGSLKEAAESNSFIIYKMGK